MVLVLGLRCCPASQQCPVTAQAGQPQVAAGLTHHDTNTRLACCCCAPAGHPQPSQPPVACTTEEAGIPGLFLLHDFITEQEEQQLLACIDSQPWLQLSKRRVQHYGYRFEYTTRGVDVKERVGPIPEWAQPVVQRVQVGHRRGCGGHPAGWSGGGPVRQPVPAPQGSAGVARSSA